MPCLIPSFDNQSIRRSNNRRSNIDDSHPNVRVEPPVTTDRMSMPFSSEVLRHECVEMVVNNRTSSPIGLIFFRQTFQIELFHSIRSNDPIFIINRPALISEFSSSISRLRYSFRTCSSPSSRKNSKQYEIK